MKTKKQKPKSKLTLKQLVKAARALGCEVSVSLEDKQMPTQFPDDPEPVKLLIAESRRVSALGNKWKSALVPNEVAAIQCLRMGWAHSLSAAWLRAKLKGEFDKENK